MTTMRRTYFTCAACSTQTEFSVIASTNAFGSSDLDLRPPEMQRSTMPLWVQECPVCGYAARRIDEVPAFPVKLLSTPGYRNADGLAPGNELARRFYRQHLCAEESGKLDSAVNALVCAAWSCDDQGDSETAKELRARAVVLIDRVIAEADEPDEQLMVRRSDLLRRSGQFDRLIREYKGFSSEQQLLNDIIAFELALSARKDDKCYTVQDACDAGMD